MSRKQGPRKPSPLSQRERGAVALSPCEGELERGLAGMRPAENAPQGDSDPLWVNPTRPSGSHRTRTHAGSYAAGQRRDEQEFVTVDKEGAA